VFLETPLNHRERLLIAFQGQRVNVLKVVRTSEVGDVLPVLGPVFHHFIGGRFKQGRFLAYAAAIVHNIDIRIAFTVGGEGDPLAVGSPNRVDVVGGIQG